MKSNNNISSSIAIHPSTHLASQPWANAYTNVIEYGMVLSTSKSQSVCTLAFNIWEIQVRQKVSRVVWIVMSFLSGCLASISSYRYCTVVKDNYTMFISWMLCISLLIYFLTNIINVLHVKSRKKICAYRKVSVCLFIVPLN